MTLFNELININLVFFFFFNSDCGLNSDFSWLTVLLVTITMNQTLIRKLVFQSLAWHLLCEQSVCPSINTTTSTCRHLLCLSSVLHPSAEHFKANYVTVPHKGCLRLPRCSFFSLFLEDALILRGLTYPKILCVSMIEEKGTKMATSRGVNRHSRGPGQQKSWC